MQIVHHQLVSYLYARQIQQHLVSLRQSNSIPDTIYFCEHFPILTVGKRGIPVEERSNLELVFNGSTAILETNRGGLATLHNPGQLIVYPVINLRERGISVRDFVCNGLCSIQKTLEVFGIDSTARLEPVGVFVEAGSKRDKIAYVGLQVSKGITNHGFAINICNDLSQYLQISSCGLPVGSVTSLSEQLLLAGRTKIGLLPLFRERFAEIFYRSLESPL